MRDRTSGSWWLENDDGEIETFLLKVEKLVDAEGYRRFRDALTSDDLFSVYLSVSDDGELRAWLQAEWPNYEAVERLVTLDKLLHGTITDAERGHRAHPEDLEHELKLVAALRRAAERIEKAVERGLCEAEGRSRDAD